jgi:uncharacterized protein (DUF1501 family)
MRLAPVATTRRQILQRGLLAGASLVLGPGIRRLGFAAPGADRGLLVIVHLRGGCDGLHFISPANDPDFIAARISDLRVAAEGPEAGHALPNGPDPHVDFRLHASGGGLAELYQGGHLAFVHAAGLSDATRSHFVASDLIEHGVAGSVALARSSSGWLARYQQAIGVGAPGGMISAAGATSGEFQGSATALAVPDLGGGFGTPGGPQVGSVVANLYRDASGAAASAGRAALAAIALIDGHVSYDAQHHAQPYVPEHNVAYDPAGDFARPLKTVAQLAKMEIGLAVATVDIGGWDTHENQPGRFRNAVERLSSGITAFYEDMWRYHDRLTLVTVSEFGRRLRSNRSTGTDHGRAGVIGVLGGKVAGGRIYGRWPGLHAEKLDEGVDLAVATDYRQVLGEILGAHSPGVPLAQIFPDYRSPGALGILARADAAATAPHR